MKRFLIMTLLTFGLMCVASIGYSSDVEKAQVEASDLCFDFNESVELEVVVNADGVDDTPAEPPVPIEIKSGYYFTLDVMTALKANKTRYWCSSFIPPEQKGYLFS